MPRVVARFSTDARRTLAIGIGLAAAYVLAAQLGFRFALVAEQVTTVWAPTGIAQAALLLLGASLWPAVWLGAFVANVGTQMPVWAAAAVATGNTLEALVAVWLLPRFRHFDPTLRRLRDVLAFIVVAALLSPVVSATIGVIALCVAQVQPWARLPVMWGDWWLGDAIGALVVGPAILTMARTGAARLARHPVEATLIVVGGAVATQVIFGQAFGIESQSHPFEYVIFPFVIAAAVRLGQPATALTVLATSSVTIWDTVAGEGPFADSDLHRSLILLQVFMGVLAGTGLLLAAAMAERRTGERRRAAAAAVGEVLGSASSLVDAAPALLQSICERLDWSFGALWLVDRDAGRLRCLAVWRDAAFISPAFEKVTVQATFVKGVGLPGRVWESEQPAWIENVVHDRNFPRAPTARAAGIRGAFGFPICVADEVLGVIEIFNRTVLSPDEDLLLTMSSVGNQIGQFMRRTRVEAAILGEQRRMRAILETAADAIIGMDHQGVITEFNPAAERIFGYRREQAIGRELAELLIPTALRDKHRHGLAHYLATGQGPFIGRRIETTGYHADGRELPVEVSISRVSDDDPPRFTGFVRDLTERSQAEREREHLLLSELRARREAEAANRAKDEFLATLSHELRTPLNAIVGWTRMLLEGTMDGGSSRRALEVIDRNAQLQVRLVSDILDVSRIITGGLKLDVRPVDLGSVIGAALDAVRPAADAKKIQLRSRLTAPTRITLGDAQRLQQAIWNLLANAVKFTKAGGRVEVELLDGADGGFSIQVVDDGAGIDPAFLPYVFERFRQADGSISREHGGLGLGLAIVRHLVELHGGTVKAHSDGPGHGSIFTIDLPSSAPDLRSTSASADREEAASSGVLRSEARPLEGCSVLAVDDDEDSRALIGAILTEAGARVWTAASVRDALKQLDASHLDVLLADIGMPGEDGYALIGEVRSRDARNGRRLPAAAVTAYAGAYDRQRALSAGFDSYLAKPIQPAEIVATVRSLWNTASQLS